jgi:shikimate kinase
MGSGKTSVGRIVADEVGYSPVDTDQLVIDNTGLQITAIFEEHGEAWFRDRETEALESLRNCSGLVVSTGGGIILRPANVAELRDLGFVVWLTADEETLHERVAHGTKRPLVQTADPRGTIRTLLAERSPLYKAASHLIVDTAGRTHQEVAETIILQTRRAH